MKLSNLPKLLVFLIITVVSIFNSCASKIGQEKIIFQDNNDDK